MPVPTFSLSAAAEGLPAGDYVDAALAGQLEQTLSKLVWQVLYGKAIDATTLAVSAEQMLAELGKPQALAA